MTPEPSPLVTVEAPVEFVTLTALWPYALAFVVVVGVVLLVQRRHR